MEVLYAIYTYKLNERRDYGDWTQDEHATAADMTKAQQKLYEMFEPKNGEFRVQESTFDGAKKYTCKVYGNDDRMVALRLQNEKDEHYWEDEPDPDDPIGKVIKKSRKSYPPTFVVIDFRPGHNILAVKVDKEAWSNPDTVRDLMEESINRNLESLSAGFRIELLTKMESRDFMIYSNRRIKKEGRAVKSLTIRFKTGKIKPKVEAVIKSSQYLKQLFGLINKYGGGSGEMTLNQPIGPKLIDRRRHDIEKIVALVASDPEGYGMDMVFDDSVALHCGKDVRADLPMKPEGCLELFHHGTKKVENDYPELSFDDMPEVDNSKYLLEEWLDNIAEETKLMKDAETIRRKGTRRNKRKAS